MWWDVEVQVHFFLVECSMNPAVHNVDGKVREVTCIPMQGEFPSQAMKFVDTLEFGPEPFVGCWVRMA